MTKKLRDTLEKYYKEVQIIILSRQNPATGLIPASVAVTTHGDYRDAWVRDNVYSIYAVWGLALSYRRLDDDQGRAFELEHATVKCMRGLLFAMMRQSHKVELFKNTQALENSLHAKYNTATGATVVGDNEWGHLQIDATSLFLLTLAQMTASGFQIIFTLDEVHFIQNLVFYIERAYRTPDYGIWERGNKINHGTPELNSSSIGMVVAALEAINGVNLFGSRGGPGSVIHVLYDEIVRNYTTLYTALPRESASKEVDAAVLAVISYPAFAIHDVAKVEKTRNEIVKKLGGRYGFKRFLRDGHQTVLENTSRLHYDPTELKMFEGIESEWPLFFTYMTLDGLFRGDYQQVEEYRMKLEPLLVDSSHVAKYNGTTPGRISSPLRAVSPKPTSKAVWNMQLVPELYIVPKECVESEKKEPGSQEREANENLPLVWAQSLYILGNLIYDDLLSPSEIDPLGRRLLPLGRGSKTDVVVQVVLLSENAELQSKLRMFGLETQLIQDCDPIIISPPSALRDAFTALGENTKLGLTGRPPRPVGSLSTCKLYRCQGRLYSFLPHFMNNEEFYLVSDNDYLITVFEQELAFVKSNWYSSGRPTMVVMLTDQMLGALRSNKNQRNSSKRNLFNFMMSLRSGICGGARVRLGRLSEMINTACIESLDFLTSSDQENWHCVLAGKNDSHTEQFVRLSLKDHMKSMESAEEGKGIPRKRRTVRRRSSSEHSINRSSKSPLTKPIIPAEEEDSNLGNFKLREHLEAPYLEDRRSQNSPVKSNDEIRDSIGGVDMADGSSDDGPALVLTLGDHSNVQSAIDVLRTSSNLYDQIDLLHYLHSCHGPDFTVDGLSTVSKLIEEVYVKATHLGQWSIVRQAAGLLRKVVNNLSINIAELLIRQKPVTVGFGDQTFSITSPMRPTALADVIYKHCWSDVREAPVVQEVITSMASFLKTNESMFEGIMCIRTHFVIIAMREEISRMKSCNEEQAVEYLMQLSPFEFKSLLGQVLMAREQTSHPTSAIQENTIKQAVSITCQSGGFKAGNFAHIDVSVDGEGQSNRGIFGRGLNVVIISPQSGAIIETGSFDTHVSQEESNEFAKTIEWTEPGSIVVVVSKDECSENLTEAAKVACESIGSSHIRSLKYRESWCIIGEKGAVMGSVPEALRGALSGPTDAIRKSVDLQVKKGSVHDHLKTQTKFNKMLPSQGRWLRRRKIDGALNRVPAHFYPKVWQLLNKTKGLKIGKAFLPREPTVNEKTPEELNFALQTETLLDHISDPAERQIAVDCIVVISRIEERNPLITLHCGAIDVLHIIREAIRTFWGKHLEANPHFLGPAAASTGPGKGVDMSPLQGSSDGSKAGKKKGHEVSLVSGISGPHSLSPVETNTTTSYPATPATNGPKRPNQRASVPDKNFSGLRKALDHDVIPVAPDTSFEQNERLARVLFLDLPSEGREGTLSYLAAACVRLVFDVEWTNDDALGLA